MKPTDKNIVLIGMPGSGKSTIGKMLAEKLTLPFVDTDHLIEAEQQCALQHIVDTKGYLHLRQLEEQVLLGIDKENHIIATGGSAVYSTRGMDYLHADNMIIFLDISFEQMLARIDNASQHASDRGLAKSASQSLEEMYAERLTLYQRYADMAILCNGRSAEDICQEITNSIGSRHNNTL